MFASRCALLACFFVACGGASAPERAVSSTVAVVPSAPPSSVSMSDAGATFRASSAADAGAGTVASVHARVLSVRGSTDDGRAVSELEAALKRAREHFEACATRAAFVGQQALVVRLVSGDDRRVLELATKWRPTSNMDKPPESALTECFERELRSLDWPRAKEDAPAARAVATPSARRGNPALDAAALRVLAGAGAEGARVEVELVVAGHETGARAAAAVGGGQP